MEEEEEDNTPKSILIVKKKSTKEAQILAKVLSNIGYSIEIISNLKELSQKIADKNYDILLIDIAVSRLLYF